MKVFVVLLLLPAIINARDAVHWLSGATIIQRDATTACTENKEIYCYSGAPKSLLTLWQTVKFHINIANEDFSMYIGSSPEVVVKGFTEDICGWSGVHPFRKPRTTTLALYNTTCMAIKTKQKHIMVLQIIRVDIWPVMLMSLGIAMIFSSKALSGNPVFFYLCGVFIGVSASFMVVVYYISRMIPRKTLSYGILIGGWTVGVYVFQQIWENIRTIVVSYQTYVLWYALVVSFVSFLVCYKIGPPRDQRGKNLAMWSLQYVGVVMIYFSSEYQEASGAVIVGSLVAIYFPRGLLNRICST